LKKGLEKKVELQNSESLAEKASREERIREASEPLYLARYE
jgi:hypothetical protein